MYIRVRGSEVYGESTYTVVLNKEHRGERY